jgi:peptide/nickel transport system permease protein
MIGLGTFFRPGTYVSVHDSLNVQRNYVLRLPDAEMNRIHGKLSYDDRDTMKNWLLLYAEQESIQGLTESDIDTEDVEALLTLWWQHYNQEKRIDGMTIAERRSYARIDNRVERIFDTEDIMLFRLNEETGEYEESGVVTANDYININEVANVITLPLGTDNFGRDVLRQLVSATGASLIMGVVAGTIATSLGLVFGLISGYVGGIVDDILVFIYNLLTVIPGIIIMILISIGIGQEQRGVMTIAIVIGMTSWVWTARSVRSQVMSLRNRDHVNLSKLSGHSLPKILARDITPYIASYVVMAFILQVSSAILAEAGLSMLGLGPKTTEQATLGIMMQWATSFGAHLSGAWWAYLPVILLIAFISFSLNLMNTGLDQIFNPQLREG